jgi:hypothetical protein
MKPNQKKKRKSKLKLYVWQFWNPDWTGGIAFAIAPSETIARRLVIAEYGHNPDNWGNLSINPITRRIAYAVCGGS